MNGYYIELRTVMEAKLTKAQEATLRSVAQAERNGRKLFLNTSYPPRKKLIELGLIEDSKTGNGTNWFQLTKAGKDVLARLVADEKKSA